MSYKVQLISGEMEFFKLEKEVECKTLEEACNKVEEFIVEALRKVDGYAPSLEKRNKIFDALFTNVTFINCEENPILEFNLAKVKGIELTIRARIIIEDNK